MTVVTVVLCPALDSEAADGPRRELAAALAGWGIPVVVPRRTQRPSTDLDDERLTRAAWVADQAVAITEARVDGPIIVVSSGPANRAVPALAFSQRASRRTIVAYVLVDGPLPEPSRTGADWPDAPVFYVAGAASPSESTRAAKLRGWTTLTGDAISTVTAIARGWPDSLP
jgi:hypothetical protein